MYTQTEIKKILSEKLSPSRYEHTLGVCKTATEMAKRFSVDVSKAEMAALLHDCAKYMSFEEQIEKARETELQLTKEEILCPAVIHAPLGATIAKLEYGVTDIQILDAISSHTTAKENMTQLDKIIYVADLIEPGRSFEGVDYLRELSEKNLDSTYLECLKVSIMFNLNKHNRIHSDSLKAWNAIIKKGR